MEECPIRFRPLFYRRYVDDTFALFRYEHHAESFLEFVNRQHQNIRFTMEKEVNSKLPFLDLIISRGDSGFCTGVYRKNTFTGLGMNFYSSCFFNFKLNSILTLLHRAYTHSSNWLSFHDEISFLTEYFNNNCFPSRLFFRSINKLLAEKMTRPALIATVPKLKMYASFPFVHDDTFRRKCMSIIQKGFPALNLKIIPRNPLTIGSLFRVKDRLSPLLSSSVVYKYTCPRCDHGIYVGCTKRLLKVRIDSHRGVSHRTGSRLSNPEQSNIRNHSKLCKTYIDNKDFSILGQVQNNNDLTILESIIIKKTVPSLNTHSSSVKLFIA